MVFDVWFSRLPPGGGATEVGGGATTDAGAETEIGGRGTTEGETRTRSDTQQKECSAATIVLAWWQVVIAVGASVM